METSYHLALGKNGIKFAKTGVFNSSFDKYVLYHDSFGTGIAIEEKWVGQFENDIQIPNEAVKWNFQKSSFDRIITPKEEDLNEKYEEIEPRNISEENLSFFNEIRHFDHYYLLNNKTDGLLFNLEMELEVTEAADFWNSELCSQHYSIIHPDKYFKKRIKYKEHSFFILGKYSAMGHFVIINGIKHFLVQEDITPTYFIKRKLNDKYLNIMEIELNGKSYILFEDEKSCRYAIHRYGLNKYEEDLTRYNEDYYWTRNPSKLRPEQITHNGIKYDLYIRQEISIGFHDVSYNTDSFNSITGEPDIDRLIQDGKWHDDML